MASSCQPSVNGLYSSSRTTDPGTSCRNLTATPGVVGSTLDDVSRWEASSKIIESIRLAVPKLPKQMQSQFADLLSPVNIAITVGVLGTWIASHAFGVGELFDLLMFIVGLAMVGPAIFQCAKDLVKYATLVREARVRSDLDAASIYLARVVSVLGVTVFMVLLTKFAAKRVSMVKGGTVSEPAVSPVSETTAPPAGTTPQRAYEVLLPADQVMEGDGALALAMRKAALDDWYRSYPALNKWRKFNSATGKFETAGQKRASHIDGTDLSMPVIRRTLEPGTEIIQFQRIGGQLGVYLGFPGAIPSELGILGKGRIVRLFRVIEPLEALETTAKEFSAGKVSGVGGKGGGQQLIMPPDWERRVQQIW